MTASYTPPASPSPTPRSPGPGEGEAGGVDDAVIADQSHRDLGGLPHPLPASSELRDVRHHTQHALLTSVHSLCLHIAKPDLEVGGEALPGELQHGHVPAAVEMQVLYARDWCDWIPDRAHALEESVFHLVCGDDRPTSAIIEHFFCGLFWTGSGLELDDPLLGQTEVHPVSVLHVESAFVQLRHWVI